MSKSDITIRTVPSRYRDEAEINFSSPVGGGLIGFKLTENSLSVHVYRQDMTVTVTAGDSDTPIRSGNLHQDRALYQAAKAFVASWEAQHPKPTPAQRTFLVAVSNDTLPTYNSLGALRRMANRLIKSGWLAANPAHGGDWTRYSLTDAGRRQLGEN